MAEETSSQRLEPQRATGLGRYLQGVQHVGVTVDDMARSLEFYIDVLGGKLAIKGNGFYGDVLTNTLFQKEELDALERDISPRSLGVPEIRTGQNEALDVVFVSFGNTVVELLHFRDAKLDPNAPNTFPKLPPGVGHGNAGHISFYVKDDVDLNAFAKQLEEECRRRGIKNVVCNRIVQVKSEAERRAVALKHCANKFWNDPDYFVEGYSDSEFGDFLGWSLFYCKGPNGEQLEFNQVTRQAREHFDRARQQYNEANGTTYEASRSQPSPDAER
jgi:catechol 2,3-dioxygenase-like lactoylglutathione lyase family enzyme